MKKISTTAMIPLKSYLVLVNITQGKWSCVHANWFICNFELHVWVFRVVNTRWLRSFPFFVQYKKSMKFVSSVVMAFVYQLKTFYLFFPLHLLTFFQSMFSHEFISINWIFKMNHHTNFVHCVVSTHLWCDQVQYYWIIFPFYSSDHHQIWLAN